MLYEVSGLTDIDSTHVGCVQDEKGRIFVYNLNNAQIESNALFYIDGDYEGITKVDDDMWILRSDGFLFRIKNYVQGASVARDSFNTHIPINNNEGLCFDEKNHILLITAKGKKKSQKTCELRFVYGFRLDSLQMIDTTILTVNVNDIQARMSDQKINLPLSKKKNGETKEGKLKFMPSSIAIHPITNRFYILSAIDGLLAVFNRNGKVEEVYHLSQELFPKAEGLTFLPNGDMFIANEGKGGKANLMRFCYCRK